MSDDQDNDSCQYDDLRDQLVCIVTYKGDNLNVWINYITLLVNVAVAFWGLLLHTKHRSRSGSMDGTRLRCYALGCLVFVTLFQLLLCTIVGCYGISIIWCAIGGWMFVERRRHAGSSRNAEAFLAGITKVEWAVLLADLGVIVYYLVVAEAITTVAHICAITLGALLSLGSLRLCKVSDDNDAAGSQQTSSTPLVDDGVIS